MKIRSIVSIAVLALALAACVKDDLASTHHPNGAQISVSLDWSAVTATRPANLNLVTGRYLTTISGNTSYTIDSIFAPGHYRLRVFNSPVGFQGPVDTAFAVLAPQQSTRLPYPAPNQTFVVSDPTELSWLFTGLLDTIVKADKDYDLQIKMTQQVGEVTITLTPDPSTSPEAWNDMTITSALLSGVATTIDLRTSALSTPDTTQIAMFKNSAGNYEGKARLLGIAGTTQQLRFRVSLRNQAKLIDSVIDMRALLLPLNSNKAAAIPITRALKVSYPAVDPEFDAGMNPWDTIPGNGGNVYEE